MATVYQLLTIFVILAYKSSRNFGQKPWPCAYRSASTCGYYMSNNPSDFEHANQICQYYDDSVLASAEVALNLNTNGNLKWVGFRSEANESDWYWIGNRSLLSTTFTKLFTTEGDNKNVTTLKNNNTAQTPSCIAARGFGLNETLVILPCIALLTETLCQRPLRNQCHLWNFTYGCMWEDEKCEHRYEEKSHDGDFDESGSCTGAAGRLFRQPCQHELCENCKLTAWSQWSPCQRRNSTGDVTACNNTVTGVTVRSREILAEAKVGKLCSEHNLRGNRKCQMICPTTTILPNQDPSSKERAGDLPKHTADNSTTAKAYSSFEPEVTDSDKASTTLNSEAPIYTTNASEILLEKFSAETSKVFNNSTDEKSSFSLSRNRGTTMFSEGENSSMKIQISENSSLQQNSSSPGDPGYQRSEMTDRKVSSEMTESETNNSPKNPSNTVTMETKWSTCSTEKSGSSLLYLSLAAATIVGFLLTILIVGLLYWCCCVAQGSKVNVDTQPNEITREIYVDLPWD